MSASSQFISPSEAAKRLGVSTKALRLYEQRGLIAPIRTANGWRVYGPDEIVRTGEIVALRALGLSLSQIARLVNGNPEGLESALMAHEAVLEGRISQLVGAIERISRMRSDLASGRVPTVTQLARLPERIPGRSVAFDLPWPWGGELFELHDIRALNFIIGPLGSGKTRLAMRIAETLPDATFLGLDRLADGGEKARAQLNSDKALKSRVDTSLAWLVEDGATASDALITLIVQLVSEGSTVLVIDMLEQDLDKATQEAVIAYLRRREPSTQSLFFLTRSSAILDLDAVGPNEAIILCPANHSPPTLVAPLRGTPGYEAVATCLASPEVRARTEGVISWRPKVA
jgi:DNA-binding transcriptional MerR regulator